MDTSKNKDVCGHENASSFYSWIGWTGTDDTEEGRKSSKAAKAVKAGVKTLARIPAPPSTTLTNTR